ncbi:MULTISPECIES: transglycosylase domain-containing protein [Prevotellaceae]|jgi:penicillin-binding protein 1A|uniref:transglycosylase domain-containing protein n=1 Tax=Xylanibacter rarus TaxID=1676614 RepID=UPI00257E1748|nr:transglycosylase domain-containing protein [Prevotella sp.]MBS5876428.1 transglycosylase domain-containing protein [Prevotella sp.]HJH77375.1 transglycosylase domain-containing protein [Prevotellaceae bacterium]
MRKTFVRILWGTLCAVIVFLAVSFTSIWFGWIGYMPDLEDLQNPISRYASQVYSVDGKILGTYNMNRENRVHVDYDGISPYLVQALVATEDERFYDHSGIDFIALTRAVVKRGILGQKSAGGGSTITQQLAKQLYSATAKSTLERLLQKPIEWVIAVKLERFYTKEEIITMYLNYFDFLHNAVGIKTAADVYFDKDPKNLTLTESATLIGLCKNPSYFNPVRYPERCTDRRNVVLGQMLKAGYLTNEEYQKAHDEPLALNFHRVDHKDGIATYFREFLRQYIMAQKPTLEDYPSWNRVQFTIDSLAWETDPLYGWCNKNHKKNGEPYNVYTDGLKIFTTIDSRMQKYAEEAVLKHVGNYLQPAFTKENRTKPNAPFTNALTAAEVKGILNRSIRQSERYRAMKEQGATESEIQKAFRTPVEMSVFTYHGDIDTVMTPLDSIRYIKSFLRSGFVSMDPHNGAVKAYVGGVDFTHFTYDMATQGRRQVGSTIKPFLYALSMSNGMSPCDVAPNVQRSYGNWTPRNGSRSRYGQMVTLKWGLAQSNNWISAYLMSRINPQDFLRILRDFGINTYGVYPSIVLCLGPNEASVCEMVSAYTTFANHGIHCSPMFVSKIEDNEGNVIATFQPRMNEVISEESAYKMLEMLKAVMDGGTGSRMRYKYKVECDMGGKTGTTNRNADAWFMGFTPSLVSGCWVGGEDRDIHFDSTRMGQGANMALPIWAYYMKKVFADRSLGYDPNEKFDIPEDFNPCVSEFDDYSAGGIEEVFE